MPSFQPRNMYFNNLFCRFSLLRTGTKYVCTRNKSIQSNPFQIFNLYQYYTLFPYYLNTFIMLFIALIQRNKKCFFLKANISKEYFLDIVQFIYIYCRRKDKIEIIVERAYVCTYTYEF